MADHPSARVPQTFAIPLAERTRGLAVPAPPRGPAALPAAAVAGARAALERGETHYTDRPGIEPLRALVARRLTGAGFPVDAAHVLITCGIEEARFVVAQQTLGEGDAAAAADPATVAGSAALCGARAVALGEPARTAFVAASGDLEAARASAGPEGWVVLELPDARGEVPAPAGATDRTVVIGTLGREAGLASERIGYLACASGAYARLRAFKQALTICTTSLSQWAALAWFEEQPEEETA